MIRTLALALVLAACDGGTTSPPPADPPVDPAATAGTADAAPAVDARVARAAAVAKDMAGSDDAAAVLAKHGLTADELEALMLEIAADADLSKAYQQAR